MHVGHPYIPLFKIRRIFDHQQWLQVLLKHLEVIFGVLKTALVMVEDIQSVPKAKDTFTIFLTDTQLLGGVRSIKNLYPPLCMLH